MNKNQWEVANTGELVKGSALGDKKNARLSEKPIADSAWKREPAFSFVETKNNQTEKWKNEQSKMKGERNAGLSVGKPPKSTQEHRKDEGGSLRKP